MTLSARFPKKDGHGWTLVSVEGRYADHPDTFEIPSQDERSSLLPGDGAKLLFDIETRENGRVIDRGVDRMWVIVRSRREGRYLGVLDSDPGTGDGLVLHAGDEIVFGPEHVAAIDRPPREYIVEKYGADFFVE